MSPSDEQAIIQESKLILTGIVDLRKDLAEFRREMQADFTEINATCDRIDGHLSDISAMFRKANRALR